MYPDDLEDIRRKQRSEYGFWLGWVGLFVEHGRELAELLAYCVLFLALTFALTRLCLGVAYAPTAPWVPAMWTGTGP